MSHSRTRTRLRPSTWLLLAAGLPVLFAGAPASAQTNHDVAVVNNRFEPREITIQPGDSVTWTNSGVNHNVVADDGSFRCANGCDSTGGNGNPSSQPWVVTLTFDDPGDIPYFCEVHGTSGGFGMAGVVHVEGQSSANPGNLTLASSNFPVGEGGGLVSVRVDRVNGADGAVSVDYATSDGTATAPADYQSASGTLNWADGDGSAKSFQVQILDDGESESQERFNVRLTNPTGGAGLGRDRATVTVNDNDEAGDGGGDGGDDGGDDGGSGGPGRLHFRQALYEVDEAAGAVMVHVERVEGSSGTVSAQVEAFGGTATEGADFLPVTETVTFVAGDTSSKSVMIPILQDGEDEGAETIHVELSGPGGGAVLGDPDATDVAILDDEGLDDCAAEDPRALCLGQGGRFKVQVSFRNRVPGGDTTTDRGQALPLIREVDGEIREVVDSGLFTFFDPDNAELLVKVLPFCFPPIDHFAVFYGATTNVEFTLTVTDTQQGEVFFRSNPLGQAAEPVLATNALDTCP